MRISFNDDGGLRRMANNPYSPSKKLKYQILVLELGCCSCCFLPALAQDDHMLSGLRNTSVHQEINRYDTTR